MTNGLDSTMIEITFTQAMNLAGVYASDSDFERDLKFTNWVGKRSYRCINLHSATYSADLEQARDDGIEVLIIKEK